MNMNTNVYLVNVNTAQSSTQLKFCGVGPLGVNYGAVISNTFLNPTTCTKCSGPYEVVNGSCIACNVTCHCDGWTTPIINGNCTPLCGDGLIRGT